MHWLIGRRYDRYWQGRSSWSDVIRTSRTFARFVWFHIPLRYTQPGTSAPIEQHQDGDDSGLDKKQKELKSREKEIHRMMTEKHMALDMIERYVRAVCCVSALISEL